MTDQHVFTLTANVQAVLHRFQLTFVTFVSRVEEHFEISLHLDAL